MSRSSKLHGRWDTQRCELQSRKASRVVNPPRRLPLDTLQGRRMNFFIQMMDDASSHYNISETIRTKKDGTISPPAATSVEAMCVRHEKWGIVSGLGKLRFTFEFLLKC